MTSIHVTLPLNQLFDYVSYYDYGDGIKGFVMCILKKDICTELKRGNVVEDIVIYEDGMMDIFNYNRVYRTYITLGTDNQVTYKPSYI